jgi:N-sulfoglucosamine sulfohydrolase
MLLMRGPGGFTGGKVYDTMVSHLDIYPTLCEIAGAERPDFLQGASLLPLVHDEVPRIHDEVFTEVTFHAAYEPTRAVRTERWKYIRRFDEGRHPVLANCDDSASKETLVAAGWADQVIGSEQLYDLTLDPNEMRNLVEDADHAGVLEELRERLTAWMEETGDPLLEGPVPVPPGAVVNDPSQASPNDPLHTGSAA